MWWTIRWFALETTILLSGKQSKPKEHFAYTYILLTHKSSNYQAGTIMQVQKKRIKNDDSMWKINIFHYKFFSFSFCLARSSFWCWHQKWLLVRQKEKEKKLISLSTMNNNSFHNLFSIVEQIHFKLMES